MFLSIVYLDFFLSFADVSSALSPQPLQPSRFTVFRSLLSLFEQKTLGVERGASPGRGGDDRLTVPLVG
ncbi:MAG: hypothetical protein IJY15_11050, partial [Thermoguttaceae bacterium]|nr:hypothetical protein [Thermoguttaceae bacterium]